ncbi:transcriptional repressor [Candidatus Woesearchaeota archaeon]|jgi:Fe2+ or Zn2+ uptake regulation protein|nr:transcriptional repressor [Candidatus Woesearchaeota archaeon]|tara:strand:- start:74 stop:478 length:405 start_codon:yes stop_codon:yes gene_type:complete
MIINKKLLTTRNTIQKKGILEYLKNVKTHPTAEIVFKKVIKKMPKITLATVYRNLNQMAEQKKILRLEINKEYHYDACTKKHQHGVCQDCGKIIDFFQNNISDFAIKNLKTNKFKANNVSIMFKGLCDECEVKK